MVGSRFSGIGLRVGRRLGGVGGYSSGGVGCAWFGLAVGAGVESCGSGIVSRKCDCSCGGRYGPLGSSFRGVFHIAYAGGDGAESTDQT